MEPHAEIMRLVRQLTPLISRRATQRVKGFPIETEAALDEMVDRAFYRLGKRLGEVLDEMGGKIPELSPRENEGAES